MTERADIEAALDRIGRLEDQAIDLGETALLLAQLDEPRADLKYYQAHMAELAQAVRMAAPADVAAAARALSDVIASQHGYDGDHVTYDDPQNANLIRVIDRRKGLPVALGILYAQAGRGAGWRVDGLSFPAHFLIRVERRGERAIMDPFNGGKILDAAELRQLVKRFLGADKELQPAHTQAVSNRAILLRLQNNLKVRAMAEGEVERGATLLRDMLRLAPEDGVIWLDYAHAQMQLGQLHAARRALASCLEHSLDGFVTLEAQKLAETLRLKLN